MPNEKLALDIDPTVDCHSCGGVCCHAGTVLPLSLQEAGLLQAAGTDMVVQTHDPYDVPAPDGRQFYLLNGDCGNLDADGRLCTVYEDRPQVCRDFVMGSVACQGIRDNRGVGSVDLAMPTFRHAS